MGRDWGSPPVRTGCGSCGCPAWRRVIVALRYLKGAYKKDGDRLFSRACCNHARGNGFNWKEGRFRLEEIFYDEGAEVVKHYWLCVALSNVV